jgi:hypothetical protein
MDKLQNAIKIFSLENNQYILADIKAIYRQLASKNHPDKGGNTETMQLINTAFEELCKFFIGNSVLNVINQDNISNVFDFSFISELKTMHGVKIEVCGYWIWLSGDTYLHKEKIQALGFKFSGAKKSWYWSPTIDMTKYRRGCWSMKVIRKRHGSQIIETDTPKSLN